MPAGEPFSAAERDDIEQAVKQAEKLSGLIFSVYVGNADPELRSFAERQHASLPEPEQTVLVAVDPAARSLEIVTGEVAQRVLSNEDCRLAALAMTSSFAEGDLAGGIRAGLLQLGEHARRPATLHTEDHV